MPSTFSSAHNPGAGAATAVGANQNIIPADPGRAVLYVSNPSATNDLWLILSPTQVPVLGVGIYLKGGVATPIVLEGYTGAVSCWSVGVATIAWAEL